VPRSAPGRIRATARDRHPTSTITGLSPAGAAAIARLEHGRLGPGTVGVTLLAWTRLLGDPYHRLFDPTEGCGDPMCCPDPTELRRTLAMAAAALPSRDARVFRKRLAALDELW